VAPALAIAFLLLVASGLSAFLAARREPELLRALAPRALRDAIESLPAGTPAPTPATFALGFYVRHNVGVALLAVALGFTFGVGTLALLVQNGAVAGISIAIAVSAGAGRSFAGFVIPHAPWELGAITIAAAAGLHIGWALMAPGLRGRAAALRAAIPHATRLLAGAALLLAIAGVLETTLSPRALPLAVKLGVSGAGALALAAWLALGGRHA
jgi:uncharacterized membrane protein SpoIIM required for sporulation